MKGAQHELEDTDTFAGERMLKNNEKSVAGWRQGADYRSGRGEGFLLSFAQRLGRRERQRERERERVWNGKMEKSPPLERNLGHQLRGFEGYFGKPRSNLKTRDKSDCRAMQLFCSVPSFLEEMSRMARLEDKKLTDR